VENLAYEKDSFVNSRRQHKRHTRRNQQQRQQQQQQHSDNHDHATTDRQPADRQNAVDSGIHSCTVLDNFYVETPVFMVDLGKKTTVSGVIIVTWPGNPNGKVSFIRQVAGGSNSLGGDLSCLGAFSY